MDSLTTKHVSRRIDNYADYADYTNANSLLCVT